MVYELIYAGAVTTISGGCMIGKAVPSISFLRMIYDEMTDLLSFKF